MLQSENLSGIYTIPSYASPLGNYRKTYLTMILFH